MPMVDDRRLTQPQIPVNLPTYDEIIGRDGITNENYNDHILSLIQPDRLNVLTIHAEVEGIVCRDLFDAFLGQAAARGIETVPCGTFIETAAELPSDSIDARVLPGREGWIAFKHAAAS